MFLVSWRKCDMSQFEAMQQQPVVLELQNQYLLHLLQELATRSQVSLQYEAICNKCCLMDPVILFIFCYGYAGMQHFVWQCTFGKCVAVIHPMCAVVDEQMSHGQGEVGWWGWIGF